MKTINILTCALLFVLLITVHNSTAQNCCPRITNGLIAYYPFCGNASDASLNGNNGTVFGATLTTDRFGNPNSAYVFNGTSNYISVSDNQSLRLSNTDFTISAWVFETSVASLQDAILSKRLPGSGNGYILNIQGNLTTPGFLNYQVSGGNDPRAISADTIPLNSWKNVVVTYEFSIQTVNIYIDGILNSTTDSIPTPDSLISEDLWIGNDVGGSAYSFHGKLDDIGIYNRLLSINEIQQLQLSNSSCGCLIAYYPFTGNAADNSGNNFNGTVHGATLTTDRFGNSNSAYEFNGISDYISVQDTDLLRLDSTDFTISAWVYETSTPDSADAIVSKRTLQIEDGYIFNIQGNLTDPGLLNFQVSGGADPRATSIDSMQTMQWKNVVVTYTLNSQTLKIYIDGILNSTTPGIPSPNALTTADLWIGNDVAGAPYSFHGKMDEVRIYNCALSDSEISILYNPPTAINEFTTNSDFTIFPNPFSFRTTIKISDNEKGLKNLFVYNSLGDEVTKISTTSNEFSFEKGSLPSGIYFLRCFKNNKLISNRKLIIL